MNNQDKVPSTSSQDKAAQVYRDDTSAPGVDIRASCEVSKVGSLEDRSGYCDATFKGIKVFSSAEAIMDHLNSWGMGDIGGYHYLIEINDKELFKILEDLNWSYLKQVFVDVSPWSAIPMKKKLIALTVSIKREVDSNEVAFPHSAHLLDHVINGLATESGDKVGSSLEPNKVDPTTDKVLDDISAMGFNKVEIVRETSPVLESSLIPNWDSVGCHELKWSIKTKSQDFSRCRINQNLRWNGCLLLKAAQITLWDNLLFVKQVSNRVWILACDFNAIRFSHERQGCTSRDSSSIEFNNFIEKGELKEVKLVGKKFNWFGPVGKMSMLDKFLVSRST
ncbi:hypothetical protein V6N13_133913 [Hibiscus sabdariffa]